MAKQYQISEEDANALLNHLALLPYKDVFQFCDILRNLQEVPDLHEQVQKYHDFIIKKDLWDDFLNYSRWIHGMEDDIS
jgi:hypothetical protein